jgi:hypothetical protein
MAVLLLRLIEALRLHSRKEEFFVPEDPFDTVSYCKRNCKPDGLTSDISVSETDRVDILLQHFLEGPSHVIYVM